MPAGLSFDAPRVVELPALLDLKSAAPLAAELLALRGRPVQIDGTRVERLGGQCLQVLLSAVKTWKREGLSFELVTLSGDFTEGLARLGISAADFTLEEETP